MTRYVAIQYQDALGNWVTSMTVPNEAPVIVSGMNTVALLFQARRIRAVDRDGNLVDLL
jgi:hypothetical protein